MADVIRGNDLDVLKNTIREALINATKGDNLGATLPDYRTRDLEISGKTDSKMANGQPGVEIMLRGESRVVTALLSDFMTRLPPAINPGVITARPMPETPGSNAPPAMRIVMTKDAYDAFVQTMAAERSKRMEMEPAAILATQQQQPRPNPPAQQAPRPQQAAPQAPGAPAPGEVRELPLDQAPRTTQPGGFQDGNPAWIANDGTMKNFDVVQVLVDYNERTGVGRIITDGNEVEASKPGERHYPQRWWVTRGTDVTPGRQMNTDDPAHVGNGNVIVSGGVRYEFKQPYDNTPLQQPRPLPSADVPTPPPPPREQGPAPNLPEIPRLPATATGATSLEQLANANFGQALGRDVKPGAQPEIAEQAHREFYESTTDMQTKMREYFAAPPGSPERLAAQQGIIQTVDKMPDAYKALAVAYVKESLTQGAGVMVDEYQSEASTLYHGGSVSRTRGFIQDKTTQEAPAQAPQPVQPAAPAAPPQGVAAQVQAPQAAAPAPAFDAARLPIMMPPAQVTNRQEFEAAHNAANAALQQMKMTFWASSVDSERMSPAQMEQVIARHEAVYPGFGAKLREAYTEMQGLSDRTNGPVDVYNKGVDSLREVYDADRANFARAPRAGREVERPDPQPGNAGGATAQLTAREINMFMARPQNLGASFTMGSAFMGMLDKNPGLISPAQIEQVFKSYDEAYPKLGQIMRDTYSDMQKATTPEQRHAEYEEGLKQMLDFRRDPTALNVDPARAAQMAAAAQVPGGPLGEPMTVGYNDVTGLRPRTEEAPQIAAIEDPKVAATGGMKLG